MKYDFHKLCKTNPNEYARKRYQENPEMRKREILNEMERRKKNMMGYRKYQRKYHYQSLFKYKKLIFQELGAFCNNCGENDPLVLQIDHVNGGGCKERESFGHNVSYYKYVLEEIINGSKEYQILCANCNTRKRFLNNEVRKQVEI